MFGFNQKLFLLGSVSVLMAGVLFVPTSDAHAQTAAHPAPSQVFKITASAGRWNQPYTYDYSTSVGTLGTLRSGSSNNYTYTLRSSFDVAEPYGNYVGLFIYDYTSRAWVEALYIVDGTNYQYAAKH